MLLLGSIDLNLMVELAERFTNKMIEETMLSFYAPEEGIENLVQEFEDPLTSFLVSLSYQFVSVFLGSFLEET
jgi:hypothetical protein